MLRLLAPLAFCLVLPALALAAPEKDAAAEAPAPEKTPAKKKPAKKPAKAEVVIDRAAFDAWLVEFRKRAAEAGIGEQTLKAAVDGIAPIKKVIELDRRQPHSTMTWKKYRRLIVTKDRIETGRKLFEEHREKLEKASKTYGVQPQFIVALWGIETSFGTNTGGFDIVPALATLAWEGRRASFFEKELLAALKILDAGDVAPDKMTGSWAGAMGQCQFMPSSYLSWAADGDGDGKRDIWTNLEDVFASAANYLKTNGWNDSRTWGRRVKVPEGFDRSLIDKDSPKPLSEWASLGVTRPNGKPLPAAELEGALVIPGGKGKGPVFLVYSNYKVLLHWNRSTYFATAVGLIADGIAAPGPKPSRTEDAPAP